jgi:glycosyltransferase involved in cell wall biosynthesis
MTVCSWGHDRSQVPPMTADAAPRQEDPLLSIVLPVGGVAGYLSACLDSVFGQPPPPGGIEVIAVDDASPDESGAILDARARSEPALRVIHLAGRGGPGPARMRGLAEARGHYIWFADPDDLLTAGSLAAVAAALTAWHPEVLLLDYRVLHPGGATEPSPGAELLTGTAAVLTLADRPALVNRTMTAWSKVIGRRFLQGLGVGFPPGIHEDVAVSCAVLLAARRIALLDRPCYLYRRRAGSFLATPSMDHFSIFAAYERVFGLLRDAAGDGGAPAAVKAAVFGRAIEHYSSILANGLVPRRARAEFFRRMAADFRRYRPEGYRRPPGWRGLKMALVERNAYRAYAVLGPLNNARVLVRRRLRSR